MTKNTNMKKITSIISLFAVAVVMPLSAIAAPAAPATPVTIHGTVKINGAPAPAGTQVKAFNGSVEIDSTTSSGSGEYFLDNILESEISVGSLIIFKINGNVVPDPDNKFKMVPASKGSVAYDLSITTQNNTSSGSSGGNSGSSNSSAGSGGSAAGGNTKPVSNTPATTEDSGDSATGSLSDEDGQVLGAADVNVADGDIIQCKNCADPNAVYIVKMVNGKKYIRHIVSLQIFNHYKHLKWENLIQVESLEGFSLSGWVRVNTGANGMPGPNDKVWEINGDQTRHWIDMTAAEFLQHGGSEEAIYGINQGELDLYREGPAVKLQ